MVDGSFLADRPLDVIFVVFSEQDDGTFFWTANFGGGCFSPCVLIFLLQP
jgi:hypothetical protein